MWQLFVPGGAASTGSLLGWSALLYLGFTMIELPHKAWGAELSPDYDERSRITSRREGLSTGGQVTLLAALVVWGASGVGDAADQLRGIELVVVIALPLLVAAAVLMVPESHSEVFRHQRLDFFAGLSLVAANPAFRRMIGCVIFFVSGIAIQGILHRLVLSDVMADESRFPLMLLIENLASLAAVPLWLHISLRTAKHRALAAAALWLALGVSLGTALPAAFGYDPAAEITGPAVQTRLMAIYGGVPALLMAVGALFLRGFPVTRERHAAVLAGRALASP